MNTKEQQQIYVSPKVKTIELNSRAIICISPDGMILSEKDCGNGGFEEES